MKTLSVGIPAFNEEANIANLIHSLIRQQQTGFVLEKIIVASDGSTDNTEKIVSEINDDRLVLIADRGRKGQAARQNEIIEKNTSDLLLLLNADVLPEDSAFISKLIQPFDLDESIGLVSGKRWPVRPEGFFEKIVAFGSELTDAIADRIDLGQNLYHCNGAVRVFSKKLLEKFRFPTVVSEDAYSYFYCKHNGFSFRYVPHAIVRYRCSQTLKDYIKQSVRFSQGQKDLAKYVPPHEVIAAHRIPRSIMIQEMLKGLVDHPILFLGYLTIACISLVRSRMKKQYAVLTWETADSSKTLTTNKS